jgi:hypothetical protein
MRVAVSSGLLALLAVTACSKKPDPDAAAKAQAASMGMHGDMAASPDANHEVTGKVLETMNAGGYTYLRLEASDGPERWAAVTETQVEVGKVVTVKNAMRVPTFHSPKLDRDFKDLLLGEIGEPSNPPPLKPETASAAMAAHGTRPTSAVAIDKPIPRVSGPGGYTVGEIYANKPGLVGKVIAVRGKVAKVNANILGRNWVHLQDGTGTEKDGTHDLVVATPDTASVGDIVLATGKLVGDKDVSGVYHFSVLLEDAMLEKK